MPSPKAPHVRSPGRQRRDPEHEYRASVGARLREVREATGKSQIGLADEVNMSPRHLGGIERGQSNVTLDVLVRLADGLGVQPSELLPPR